MSGPGTRRAATSVEEPARSTGLPGTRAGLAGSVDHPCACRKANATPPRQRRPQQPGGTAAAQPDQAPRRRAAGNRCKVGLPQRPPWRYAAKAFRRNRAHRPPARSGAPAGPRSGAAPCRQRSAQAVRVVSPAPSKNGEAVGASDRYRQAETWSQGSVASPASQRARLHATRKQGGRMPGFADGTTVS